MRSIDPKRAFSLHSSLGKVVGVAIAFVCATGALAALAPSIDRALVPASRIDDARAGDRRARWSALLASAEAHAHGGQVIVLSAPHVPGVAAEAIVRHGPRHFERLYLDPRDARVRGRGAWWNVQRFARDLHRSLFLGENVGIFVVGALAAPLLVSTLSGLVLGLRTKQRWRVRWRAGRERALRDAHRVVGLALAVMALLWGATGAWYWAELMLGWAHVSVIPGLPQVEARAGAQPRELDELVELGEAAYPELVVDSIALPTARRPVLSLLGHDGSVLARDQACQVLVEPYEGRVLGVWRPDAMGVAERWAHAADPLHFGELGGTPTRVAWGVMGLAVAIVAGVGPWIRWRRRRA
ncbi:PepSY-associated TM helix domain-containing protein [Sandaracinus amylolyticus]|uniref:Putative iron-regulated membrane protein n=1 Tax=Sandaracinus amylolyticus TaxID=927083 RepID=A0A0F6W4X9_9BACT|nr:PepSY-associated TM helix domain-containing protein [Sandaracinus amylolyticus]AKF07530.1 putative iron-regulated membrane protein [Sandaracinus amylolyticus]